jgi:MoxR-like ATPase
MPKTATPTASTVVPADTSLAQAVARQVARRVVGQDYMVERLLISLLTGGHVLLEGVPGLAKTLTVRTLAETVRTSFNRIQFTPDLLPADVIGTQVYDQSNGQFTVKRGPIFANIVLADEINRAPAKVQAALLEAMQEKQVTIGGVTHVLEEPFLVLATQNPIEQEGTYPLPEAQVDEAESRVSVEGGGAGDPAADGGRDSHPGRGGGDARPDSRGAGQDRRVVHGRSDRRVHRRDRAYDAAAG